MIEILTSPVWWSTIIALLGVIFGLKLFIDKIISEDKKIKEKRQQSLEAKNLE